MIRILAALAAALTLAACEPAPPAVPLTDDIPSQVAVIAAAEINTMRGQNLGGGVSFRDARANGPITEVDISLPLPTDQLAPATAAMFREQFRTNFVAGFCETPETQIYFELGGALDVRLIGSDNRVFDSYRVSSCV